MARATQKKRKAGRNDAEPDQNAGRRSRRDVQSEEEDSGEDENDEGDEMDIEGHENQDTLAQLSKGLVRYAISCEYSRTTIRRDAIKEKVLGPNNGRKFKEVFIEAQEQLRNVFGFELEELPGKDQSHLSAAERKKKLKSNSQPKSSNLWIMKSTLPARYRVPAILPPAKAPTADAEAAYVGFYTMVIALISLNGGELSETQLNRYLTRLNANTYTPVGKTTDVLDKLRKQGYLDRIVSKSPGDDDKANYIVGPRGRAEVTMDALAGMIREVYPESRPDDFEERLATSLGLKKRRNEDVDEDEDAEARGSNRRDVRGDDGRAHRSRRHEENDG